MVTLDTDAIGTDNNSTLMEGASGKMEESVKIGCNTSSLEGKLN